MQIRTFNELHGFSLFDSLLSISKNEKIPQIIVLPQAHIKEATVLLDFFGKSYSTFPMSYQVDDLSKDDLLECTRFLLSLLQNIPGLYLLPAEVVHFLQFNFNSLQTDALQISKVGGVEYDELIKKLLDLGFERTNTGESPGTFSITGDSIFLNTLVGSKYTKMRIEYEFNSISRIYNTEISKDLEQMTLYPITVKPGDDSFTHFSMLLSGTDTLSHLLYRESLEQVIDPLEEGLFDLFRDSVLRSTSFCEYFEIPNEKSATHTKELETGFIPQKTIEGYVSLSGMNTYVFSRRPKDVSHYFSSLGFTPSIKKIHSSFNSSEGTITIVEVEKLKDLRSVTGFIDSKNSVVALSDLHLFKQFIPLNQKRKIDESFILSLKKGDHVVHIDHGIGIFLGIKKREIDGGFREYFLIEYAKGDKIYLPIEYAEKITKYIGDAAPKISRLHELSFKSVASTIKKGAKKIAAELIKLHALRESQAGISFSKTEDEDSFISDFAFTETECQDKTWEEVSADLAKASPMDRIVCGDVGFGKTEIAMRAAFRAASRGYQVAVLSPTTVLSSQHFASFTERFSDYPFSIVELSRMTSTKNEREYLEGISSGKAQIIIGTHRLLSSDISFKKLGLIIVDEEQRFGVKHKEKLKQMKNNAHVLTLTATPIPRTLHMSLAGLRDISTLTTPPTGRMPVNTIIQPYSDEKVVDAIEKELSKGGKVFYLHNRVRTIDAVAHKIQSKINAASVSVVHGQLAANRISNVMRDFQSGKSNVLVCSSIIENGIDIPAVNTLIIEEATQFGLSQLYQLRGRVGRGSRKASAFFFYRSQKLTGIAKRRLKALQAARKLGSGFEVALKDLEIRGAGNILGQEQSGQVQTIGLTHYVRILNNAIEELKSGKPSRDFDVSIDLPIDAFIPEESIPDESERLRLYQYLAQIPSLEKLSEAIEELSQGITTDEFENLAYILELKIHAAEANITNIDTKIYFNPDESSYKRIVIQFKDKTIYEKAFSLLKAFPFIEIEETKIKMDFSKLGPDWKNNLFHIVSSFK